MKKTVAVRTAQPYNVIIEKGSLLKCGEYIRHETCAQAIAVISDERVNSIYGDSAEASLKSAGFRVCRFVFKGGEQSKNLQTLSDILEYLAENSFTHTDAVVALGGGVCGDVAGFAAACYMRGIDFFQIPTTFLAAVDSSVGGKTAVNLCAGKNLAGAFYQPCGVICDTQLFESLDEEAFVDGTAEAIKYGVVFDKALFELIKNEDIHGNIDEVVARCISLKANIVEQDERDNGKRHLLNFGHTVGHAIEKCSGYTISHGKAIAVGMIIEAAAKNDGAAKQISEVNRKYALPTVCGFSPGQLATVSLLDKKRSGDVMPVISVQEIGKCTLDTIAVHELENYIKVGMDKGL